MSTNRFEELVGLLLDDRVTAQQMDELVALLRQEPARIEELFDQLQVADLLSQYKDRFRRESVFVDALETRLSAVEDGEQFLEGVVRRVREDRPQARRESAVSTPAAVFVTAVVTAVVILALTTREPNRIDPPGEDIPERGMTDIELTDDSVVAVRNAVRAHLGGNRYLADGDALPPGRFVLESGQVQLEFYSGATVVLEGPADFEIVSMNEAVCRSGKVRAVVPPAAQGFTITSPTVETVDLGTEFALDVDASGRTQVHVFDGEVELYEPGGKRAGQVAVKVNAGDGVDVSEGGTRDAITADQTLFVSHDALNSLAALERRGRFDWWRKQSDALREDPRVAAYYSFQHADSRYGRVLRDSAGSNGLARDGAIVGCDWARGRWPDRAALEFKRPSDRVRIHVPGEFASLSLAAWVRVDGLDRPFHTLMLTDGYDEGEAHWQIDREGRLLLGVRYPETDGWDFISPPIIDLTRLGQWIHLATVYDGGTGFVSHYLNGERVAREEVPENTLLRLGDAEIGNWGKPVENSPTPIRNFNGRMDEFVILNAPLSEVEIRNWYAAGKP